MRNIDDLGQHLRGLFENIQNDEIDPKKATELNNTAGKIIGVYKAQLAYHALRGEAPVIPFLAAKRVEKHGQKQLAAPKE